MALRTILAAPLFAAALLMAAGASAGEAEIKYRQSMMKAIGGHMGAIVGVLKGNSGGAEHLKMHTQAMADLAKMAKDIFPKNSSAKEGETRALELIWEKPDDFAKVRATFEMEAAKLAEIAKGGDMKAVGAQLGVLGKSGCGSCHGTYRKKQS